MRTEPNNPISPITRLSIGLTKREYFAAMAMQGLISNTPNDIKELEFWLKSIIKEYGDIPIKDAYAKESVSLADALIKQLNKEEQK